MKPVLIVVLFLLVIISSACREQTKEELLQQGMTFADSGNHQAAVTLLKNALDKDPNYFDARLQLGVAYQQTEKLDKAENEFDKALRQAPDNHTLHIRLAEVYLSTGRPEKAIDQLSSIINADPDNLEALRIQANSYALLGNLPRAENLFRKALVIHPFHSQTTLGLAQLLYFSGEVDEGHQLVESIVEKEPSDTDAYYLLLRMALTERDRKKAIANLEAIRSVSPDDDFAAYLLSMLSLDAGNIDKARKIAAALIETKPEHPVGYRIDGVASYQSGRYEMAIRQLQKSVVGMPDLPGYYFLGLANYRAGQFEQALSSFQKALDKSPEHEQSRLMVAQTLFKQGRTDDCIQQARLVLAENEENAVAYNLLGSAHLAQGRYDQGMEYIEKAIQIDPTLAQAHLKKGLFNLALGNKKQGERDLFNAVNAAPEVLNTRLLLATYYLRQNNYPEALKTLEKGLSISPDNAVIYNLLAATKFGQNKPDEALVALKKAKALKPDYFSPYFNLANYYVSLKDYQNALLEYQEVLQVNSGYVTAMLKAAALYELLGQDDQAKSYYEKAVATQSHQGYLAHAFFQLRKGEKDAALLTLKSGYSVLPDNVDLLVAYGKALQDSGQFDEAVPVYIHLEELRPGQGVTQLLNVHLQKGDLGAAKELADRTVSESPDLPQGYLFQAAIYEKQSEWKRAEKVIQQGLSVIDNDLALRMNLARLYMKRGATEKTLSVFNDILLEKPNLVPALFAKASLLDDAGDKKQAQNIYETILTLDKDYAPALNNLAVLLIDVYTDNKRGLELAAKCFRLQPNDYRVIDTLGYALLKNGKVDQSIVFLEKASRVSSNEPLIKIHLARAYKAAGRKNDAIASLAKIDNQQTQKDLLQEANALRNELN